MVSFYKFKNCYLNELIIFEKKLIDQLYVNEYNRFNFKNFIFFMLGKYWYIIYFGIVIKEEVYIEVSSFIIEKKFLYGRQQFYNNEVCQGVVII